ncbi:MAG: WYL domain-containing protein [Kiritimatiellae bacterium]|nr:WYL domain-containing protein [Kiritimatiellia bacterium]
MKRSTAGIDTIAFPIGTFMRHSMNTVESSPNDLSTSPWRWATIGTVEDRFSSPTAPFEALLPPARRIDGVVARNIMQTAGEPADVHCYYRSMENPAGAWRWIRPTAVINDGNRWHVRAYCHERRGFRDFLLSRIETIGETRPPFEAIPEDPLWANVVSFEVMPHPKLKPEQQSLIAYDYAMTDARLQVQVREALVKYVLINLGLDRELSPPRQVLELCDPTVRRYLQF